MEQRVWLADNKNIKSSSNLKLLLRTTMFVIVDGYGSLALKAGIFFMGPRSRVLVS